MVEIKVPELGESIQEVQISQWLKKEGEWVEKDEDLVELESEKAAQSLPAPVSGVLLNLLRAHGHGARLCPTHTHVCVTRRVVLFSLSDETCTEVALEVIALRDYGADYSARVRACA